MVSFWYELPQMDEVEMAHPMCIFQCGNRLTKDTLTKEHVILNAIVGVRRWQDSSATDVTIGLEQYGMLSWLGS